MVDSNRAMSSAKSKSFSILAGYLLERRGRVVTPESSNVAFFSKKSTMMMMKRKGAYNWGHIS